MDPPPSNGWRRPATAVSKRQRGKSAWTGSLLDASTPAREAQRFPDVDTGEPGLAKLSAESFAILVASLACLVAVPFLLWLADQHILPYREEAGWTRARQSLISMEGAKWFADSRFADSEVTLERSDRGCEFMCPTYRVTISGSGRVDFEGYRYVCARGRQTAQIDPRLAVDLLADMYVGGFFELDWKTDPRWVDASTATMQLTFGPRSRAIDHYHGDVAAPRLLRDMELAIDEVAGTARWRRVYDRHQFWCRQPDGSLQPLSAE